MMDLDAQKEAITCKKLTKELTLCGKSLVPGALGQFECPGEQNHHPSERPRRAKAST